MQTAENTYFRKSLGVKCRSSQIARSFLEERIAPGEIFLLGEESYTFPDLFARDAIIREMVGPEMENLHGNSGKRPADSIAWRFDLFKRIVFRGDDSSALFLSELDRQKKQIGQLREERRSCEEQLSHSERNRKSLAMVCRNADLAVQCFALMLEAQKRNLHPDSELSAQYRKMISIAGAVAEELRTNLQKNRDAATALDCDSEPDVAEFNAIDTFREETERTMAKNKAQQEAELLASRQTLEKEREEFEHYKEKVNRTFEERRKQFQQTAEQRLEKIEEERKQNEQRIKEEKEKAIAAVRKEKDELLNLQMAAGKIDQKISEAVKRFFLSFKSSRFHRSPSIPMPALSLLQKIKSWQDIAVKSVLAFYDCSKMGDGSSGILITTRDVCLYNGQSPQRFPLLQNAEFRTTRTASGASGWIWVGVILILVGIFISVVAETWGWFFLGCGLGVLAFILAAFCGPGGLEIRRGEQNGMTFVPQQREELERFCQTVNGLCTNLRDLREQLAEIKKTGF